MFDLSPVRRERSSGIEGARGVVPGIGAARVRSGARGSLVFWSGDSTTFAAALVGQVPLVLRGLEVFNIDCAMRFNAFLLADEAFRRGVSPEDVLQRIKVQRAFTPYQILDALHAVRKSPGRSVYVLLAPCKQFFDGDVGHDEAEYLLEKMLVVLAELKAQRVPLLIVERTEYKHPAFARVQQRLRILTQARGVRSHSTRPRSPSMANSAGGATSMLRHRE